MKRQRELALKQKRQDKEERRKQRKLEGGGTGADDPDLADGAIGPDGAVVREQTDPASPPAGVARAADVAE